MRLLPVPGVFQPLSDSHMLAEYLAREPLDPGATVLDLCSGSGLLAITAAMRGARSVAVDLTRRAALSARLNAALNGVRVEALRGDLFAPVDGRRFDLIASHPPYLPGPLPRRGPSRAWDAGARGRALLDPICARAAAHLNPGGALLLIHSSVCGERETLDALRAGGLEPSVVDRRRGPLGPLLAARKDWLRERGLLLEGDEEELLIVRATA